MRIMLNPAELDDFVACSQQENRVPRRIHIPGPIDDHDPLHDVVGGRSFLRAPSGEKPGADLARYLARYGVHVNLRTISSKGGDVGMALLDITKELSTDLLVLGAYSHARFTEAIFGGVTRRVLREAEMPALMSR